MTPCCLCRLQRNLFGCRKRKLCISCSSSLLSSCARDALSSQRWAGCASLRCCCGGGLPPAVPTPLVLPFCRVLNFVARREYQFADLGATLPWRFASVNNVPSSRERHCFLQKGLAYISLPCRPLVCKPCPLPRLLLNQCSAVSELTRTYKKFTVPYA